MNRLVLFFGCLLTVIFAGDRATLGMLFDPDATPTRVGLERTSRDKTLRVVDPAGTTNTRDETYQLVIGSLQKVLGDMLEGFSATLEPERNSPSDSLSQLFLFTNGVVEAYAQQSVDENSGIFAPFIRKSRPTVVEERSPLEFPTKDLDNTSPHYILPDPLF